MTTQGGEGDSIDPHIIWDYRTERVLHRALEHACLRVLQIRRKHKVLGCLLRRARRCVRLL